MSLSDTLKRRAAVEKRIMDALLGLSRERQLTIIMAWMSIDDLEAAAETICK